ncbi:M16 family metallopeptidase [Streptomyces sp. NPDC101118]|uniref:M16 family metallopeptidase n=1 Tax=Streptomyces sp. NPDC101118 TaxID=3366109 RepID=UPI00380B76AF
MTQRTEGFVTTEVDGIPTLLAHRPGPVVAGLVFRVGRADETLATSGITHLTEHLALHRHGMGDLHYNGATSATHTSFLVEGDPAEVAEYLNGVCEALRDLPLERLETEKEILRTEAAGRAHGPLSDLPMWRYGARGHGLVSYTELGLGRIDAAAVRDWAAARFTRGNAVLWMTTDTLPEGLDLKLPAGPRHPVPAPSSALPVTPAHYPGEDGAMAMSTVVRRSVAATLFSDLLGKALFRDLRQKGGFSYTAQSDYTPRDPEYATITALADALPAKQGAVVGGFVDVLAALKAGRIDPEALEAARSARLKALDAPDLDARMLPARALELLEGQDPSDVGELRAGLRAVTAADVHEVAREAYENALFKVPGRGLAWAGVAAAPRESAEVLTGTVFPYPGDDSVFLVVADEGISLVSPGNDATVRYADCEAVVAYPDGARRLIGADGFSVAAEPTLFGLTPAALAAVDAAVPADRVVHAPARRQDQIPVPGPRNKPREREERRRRKAALIPLVPHQPFVLLSLVVGLLAVMATLGEVHAPTRSWTLPGWCWFAEAVLVTYTVWLVRRRR